jgi:hypothetical protein
VALAATSAIMATSTTKPYVFLVAVSQAMLITASEDASGLLDLDHRAAQAVNFHSTETACPTVEAGTSPTVSPKGALPVLTTVLLASVLPIASHASQVSR